MTFRVLYRLLFGSRADAGRVFIPPNTPRGSLPHSESALARGTAPEAAAPPHSSCALFQRPATCGPPTAADRVLASDLCPWPLPHHSTTLPAAACAQRARGGRRWPARRPPRRPPVQPPPSRGACARRRPRMGAEALLLTPNLVRPEGGCPDLRRALTSPRGTEPAHARARTDRSAPCCASVGPSRGSPAPHR